MSAKDEAIDTAGNALAEMARQLTESNREMAREWSSTQSELGEQRAEMRSLTESVRKTNSSLDRLVQRFEDTTNNHSSEWRSELGEAVRSIRSEHNELERTVDKKTSTDLYKVFGALLALGAVILTYVTMQDERGRSENQELRELIKANSAAVAAHMDDGHPHTFVALTQRNKEDISEARRDIRDLRSDTNSVTATRYTSHDGERERDAREKADEDIRLQIAELTAKVAALLAISEKGTE